MNFQLPGIKNHFFSL